MQRTLTTKWEHTKPSKSKAQNKIRKTIHKNKKLKSRSTSNYYYEYYYYTSWSVYSHTVLKLPSIANSPTCCVLQQFPSTPSGRCVRVSSLRSSSAMQRAALTQTVASASTMENTWSPWTWCPLLVRRHALGSQASSTWWLGSVMRTALLRGSAPVTNILFIVLFTFSHFTYIM